MATKAIKSSGINEAMKRWAFKKSGWNVYGLYHDDILYETPDVKEAVRRLPEKIVDERNFRMIRAAQLSLQKITLPPKDWVSYEEDRANRYLQEYIAQVKKEREEKEKWISTH